MKTRVASDSAANVAMSSRNVADDERSDRARHRYRKMTPDLDRPLHARVLRTEVGKLFITRGKPVFPRQLMRLRSPLTFEVVGAGAGRRTAEVEPAEPALDGELQHFPIQQH